MTADQLPLKDLGDPSTATISDCGRYRYDLTRTWGPATRRALWIMLNPSTADHELDDQTTTQCRTFTQREGLDGLVLVNLFAWRATQPTELAVVDDPVGPENETYVRRWLADPSVELVVAGWGSSIHHARVPRPPALLWAREAGRQVYCLGRTHAGEPRHPSRLAHTIPLEVYP